MRKLFILLFFGFIGHVAACQAFPSEVWHEGQLVLLAGDTLKGQVKYSLETDLVQFSVDRRTIQTYTARKLLYFEIFDNLTNRYRKFYAIPHNIKGTYKAPVIFEVLFTGEKMSLLSREAIEYQVNSYPYSMSGTYTRQELVYTHFFLKPDGSIIQYSGKRKDLYWAMGKMSGEIKKYVKADNIKLDRRSDLVKVVAYYNSLFEKE